jgi:hypothetical protein
MEVVYYVLDRDYNVYMDVSSGAHSWRSAAVFRAEAIAFAYPSRTLVRRQGVGVRRDRNRQSRREVTALDRRASAQQSL